MPDKEAEGDNRVGPETRQGTLPSGEGTRLRGGCRLKVEEEEGEWRVGAEVGGVRRTEGIVGGMGGRFHV